jgi:hypothetical protein
MPVSSTTKYTLAQSRLAVSRVNAMVHPHQIAKRLLPTPLRLIGHDVNPKGVHSFLFSPTSSKTAGSPLFRLSVLAGYGIVFGVDFPPRLDMKSLGSPEAIADLYAARASSLDKISIGNGPWWQILSKPKISSSDLQKIFQMLEGSGSKKYWGMLARATIEPVHHRWGVDRCFLQAPYPDKAGLEPTTHLLPAAQAAIENSIMVQNIAIPMSVTASLMETINSAHDTLVMYIAAQMTESESPLPDGSKT